MDVDRRKFFASVGGVAAVAVLSHEDQAEALEHFMTDVLDRMGQFGQPGSSAVEEIG